jgi:glucose/arabinose dehydrogenase
VLINPHSTPLGLVFSAAEQIPEESRGLVALRGSWNAAEPRGYAIARIPSRMAGPPAANTSLIKN